MIKTVSEQTKLEVLNNDWQKLEESILEYIDVGSYDTSEINHYEIYDKITRLILQITPLFTSKHIDKIENLIDSIHINKEKLYVNNIIKFDEILNLICNYTTKLSSDTIVKLNEIFTINYLKSRNYLSKPIIKHLKLVPEFAFYYFSTALDTAKVINDAIAKTKNNQYYGSYDINIEQFRQIIEGLDKFEQYEEIKRCVPLLPKVSTINPNYLAFQQSIEESLSLVHQKSHDILTGYGFVLQKPSKEYLKSCKSNLEFETRWCSFIDAKTIEPSNLQEIRIYAKTLIKKQQFDLTDKFLKKHIAQLIKWQEWKLIKDLIHSDISNEMIECLNQHSLFKSVYAEIIRVMLARS